MDRILDKKILIYALIFIVALFLRLYKLGSYPPSLSMDEVAIGYNAYSILKTGTDEWGDRFPLAFRSVGDYKPPINIYLTVPSIAIFGLNEFGVRFPSAILSSFTVVVFIFLLRRLRLSDFASFFGGLWLAVLPWHIHFSRGSFEAVTALFFLLLGLVLFLISVDKKSHLYVGASVISFSLSLWSYHAERLFVPIFVLLLIYFFRKRLKFLLEKKAKLLAVFLVGCLFILPFIYLSFFTQAIRERAISTSVFREQSLTQGLHNGNYESFGELIFDSDIYQVTRHILGKYLNYFDLRFWFWKGMGFTPQGFPDSGTLLFADLPLLFLGFYAVFVSKNKLLKFLAITWFFLGPLPAAFTMNEQHTLRSLVWIPAFGLFISSGAEYLKARKIVNTGFVAYLLMTLINLIYVSDLYSRQYPRFFSEYWQYGYKDIALDTCQKRDNYNEIIVTDTFGSMGPLNTGTPYLYILFYCKYDPIIFLKNDRKIDKYTFRRVDWEHDSGKKNTLLVGAPFDVPADKISEDQIVRRIYYLNGILGFVMAESHEK